MDGALFVHDEHPLLPTEQQEVPAPGPLDVPLWAIRGRYFQPFDSVDRCPHLSIRTDVMSTTVVCKTQQRRQCRPGRRSQALLILCALILLALGLTTLIGGADAAAAPAPSASSLKLVLAKPSPYYVFPVRPPEVTWYQHAHHDYPAVDIFAPEGTPVVAVTDGVIQELSRVDRWDPAVNDGATRGGLYVSIIGDDGVRYYGSHFSTLLSTLKPAMRVRAGQLLGTVGRSGNACQTPPHLHFGISRPTEAGDWEVRRGEVDPYPYLEAWRRGKMPPVQLPTDAEEP